MPLQLVTPPAGEPVTLLEAKQHLRVDVDDDDALIGSLIAAARQAAETITGRQLMTARWKLVLDAFPGATFTHAGTGATFSLPAHAVLLAKCPVQSVLSIEYLDMNGTPQTMPATDYVLDAACEPARLTPAFGKTWPPTLPQIEAITVTFDAGYGLASAVPDLRADLRSGVIASTFANAIQAAILDETLPEEVVLFDLAIDTPLCWQAQRQRVADVVARVRAGKTQPAAQT